MSDKALQQKELFSGCVENVDVCPTIQRFEAISVSVVHACW